MSNAAMVNYLVQQGAIKTERVKKAFLAVDRALFAEYNQEGSAYMDYPIPVTDGQTISAPSVVAIMLELLRVQPGQKILEIGTGSGYNTALLSCLAGEKGRVVSIEYYPTINEIAKNNLSKTGFGKNVQLILGDGSSGYEKEAPYDRIIVTAAMPYLENHPLLKQLKKDGILVAPVSTGLYQDLITYEKGQARSILPVIFVPLRGKYGFKGLEG
jgi:protein-L-isoaspartate(D-aspartate) O-methyltransferase